ncbi:uncharacterized protein LOC127285413 [Leptopilina boulardi]|uniref:uncharacterized protein LOC127285413 n=1 Tax=Leptopilina boulardi TaxID=63433 RepID=UPI0021F5B664|nr:uncharacterized protein LOC127285413 [Leptopilina boulardi]
MPVASSSIHSVIENFPDVESEEELEPNNNEYKQSEKASFTKPAQTRARKFKSPYASASERRVTENSNHRNSKKCAHCRNDTDLTEVFTKSMELLERRLLHHINRRLDTLSDAVVINQAATTISEITEKPILKTLPKETVQDFKDFDQTLSNNEESLLHVHARNQPTLQSVLYYRESVKRKFN